MQRELWPGTERYSTETHRGAPWRPVPHRIWGGGAPIAQRSFRYLRPGSLRAHPLPAKETFGCCLGAWTLRSCNRCDALSLRGSCGLLPPGLPLARLLLVTAFPALA